MPVMKMWDGTQWVTVTGQGSPGQGVPSGGSTGTLLTKASAANQDTTWTNPSVVVENAGSGQSRVAVNAPPLGGGPGLRVQPPAPNVTALDVWPAWGQGQTAQIFRVVDQSGNIGWFCDRYGRPKQFVQAGRQVVTTDPYGSAIITFPEACLTAPTVVGIVQAQAIYLHVFYLTTTQVGFACANAVGAAMANHSLEIDWIAVEIRT